MLRKFLFLSVWFCFSFIFLGINLYRVYQSGQVYTYKQNKSGNYVQLADYSLYTQQKNTGRVLSATVSSGDARHKLLERFMKDSPLAPHIGLMISEADKYEIDFRLVPAIAMCESNLGKRIPTQDSYNAFGIAVYTGQQEGAKFKNWESSLIWVFDYIHTKYISKNINNLIEIGHIWAPPSKETDDSWAKCVATFIRAIQ